MKPLRMILTAAMVVFAGYAQDEAAKDPKETASWENRLDLRENQRQDEVTYGRARDGQH